ncbi:hypothetical protein NDU88_009920 [Pleurodeles waltl]|uniref:Uncharacterized protein n=1 Tax=Pleurodeles waltl TaxID=8319 RepID=A0AAV7S1S6_PLEWA|nr:hypothetical protein NDU88_009920 [Pleurodeles waltl]
MSVRIERDSAASSEVLVSMLSKRLPTTAISCKMRSFMAVRLAGLPCGHPVHQRQMVAAGKVLSVDGQGPRRKAAGGQNRSLLENKLLEKCNEAHEVGVLSESMREAPVALIREPAKDSERVSSMMNVDIKIHSKVLANKRLEVCFRPFA